MNADTKDNRRPRFNKPEWNPKTLLGKLVKHNKVSLDDIFEFSLDVREPEIIDHFIGDELKEEVLAIKSVQKQTKAGQRTRIKAVVVIGDCNTHIGFGSKTAKDAATAIRSAISRAKRSMKKIRLGYWGDKVGSAHTVLVKESGKCGSVYFKVIPGPKGTGLVAGKVSKKILQLAGVKDIYTFSRGQTCTTENLAKATISALEKASNFYTPDLWNLKSQKLNPFLEHASFIEKLESEKSD